MSHANLSRRAIVAGAATLPAIAAMPTISAAGVNPDAELIALGEELRLLQPAYQASIVETNEKDDQAMHLVWERTGHQTPGPTQESKAIFAAVMKKADEETGADVGEHHFWNEPFADLDWEKKGARSLIEAVCAVVGLDAPTEQLDEAVRS